MYNIVQGRIVILAIDPGITTGIAYLAENGDVLSWFEVKDAVHEVAGNLSDQERRFRRVVIEQGPPHESNEYLRDLQAFLRIKFPDAVWMRPAEWKGTPRAHVVYPSGSKHARDAIGMGREFLHKERHAST